MPPTLFFAGTDTNVGKTHVACLAAKALRAAGRRVGVYKPVASGCRDENGAIVADDAVALANAAGCLDSLEHVCPQRFAAPLAPPAAAALEGRTVNSEMLLAGADFWAGRCDVLIVEGAGGLLSPLADGVLNIDLAKQFAAAKLIIVAANRLGTIHQTLSTCEAAIYRGLKPAGIVLCNVESNNELSALSNAEQISRYSKIPIMAKIPYSHLTSDESAFDESVNVDALDSGALLGFFSTKFIDALFMQ